MLQHESSNNEMCGKLSFLGLIIRMREKHWDSYGEPQYLASTKMAD